MYITALNAGSSGFARAGHVYANDVEGHWRAVTNLAAEGYIKPLAGAGKLNLVGFYGDDLELLFATDGLWEQIPLDGSAPKWSSGVQLIGLGPLTGRLIYPGAAGVLGTMHYPQGSLPQAIDPAPLVLAVTNALKGVKVDVDEATVSAAVLAGLKPQLDAIGAGVAEIPRSFVITPAK